MLCTRPIIFIHVLIIFQASGQNLKGSKAKSSSSDIRASQTKMADKHNGIYPPKSGSFYRSGVRSVSSEGLDPAWGYETYSISGKPGSNAVPEKPVKDIGGAKTSIESIKDKDNRRSSSQTSRRTSQSSTNRTSTETLVPFDNRTVDSRDSVTSQVSVGRRRSSQSTTSQRSSLDRGKSLDKRVSGEDRNSIDSQRSSVSSLDRMSRSSGISLDPRSRSSTSSLERRSSEGQDRSRSRIPVARSNGTPSPAR